MDTHGNRNNKKILVVDDDPAIVEVLHMMLELAGYDVTTSTNGNILPLLDSYTPDLILLDIMMSGVSGKEVCKDLKNRNETKEIPVIMISANRDGHLIASEACAEDFLAKPFEMQQLLSKVEKYTN